MYSLITATILLLLLSCGGNPTDPEDTTPPAVRSTSPIDNAVGISISSDIEISFSEKIDNTSLADNITFNIPTTGLLSLVDSVVRFNPDADFLYDTEYIVTLNSGISDLAGNNMGDDYIFSFHTEIDPNTLPPTVISNYPPSNSSGLPVNTELRAVFSKAIDASTLNNTTFSLSGGATGTVTYNPANFTATMTPDADLVYETNYTATITTAVSDTFGINLENNYIWTFSTPSLTPEAIITYPLDTVIIEDTITTSIVTIHPIGIDSVAYFIDGIVDGSATDISEPYEYQISSAGFLLGSEHSYYAIAYDGDGRMGYSDTLTFYHLWQPVETDDNELSPLEWPNNLYRVLSRTTDTTTELRIEYFYNWERAYFHPDSLWLAHNAVDLAIYLDTDFNSFTGRPDGGGDTLNGIGADFRILLGRHGGDTALSKADNNGVWELVYDTSKFLYHIVPNDTNYMEIGLLWTDIDTTTAYRMVLVNVFFQDSLSFIADFVPDRGDGHITILRKNWYVGTLPATTPAKFNSSNFILNSRRQNFPNPFN